MVATQSNSAQAIQYRSNHWRTVLVIALLSVNIVASLIAVAMDASQVAQVTWATYGEQINSVKAEASDALRQSVAIIQGGLFLFTSVIFLFWIHRAYKNLQAFGASFLSSSAGLAVAGFLIPIFNCFLPAITVSEIWKASDFKVSAGTAWQHVKTSPLVIIWWLIFVSWPLSNFLVSIFSSWQEPVKEIALSYYMRIGYTYVAGDLWRIVSAGLSITLVYLINRRQESKAHSLRQSRKPPSAQ